MRILISSTMLPGTRTQCLGVAARLQERFRAQGLEVRCEPLTRWDIVRACVPFSRLFCEPVVVVSCAQVGGRRARRFRRLRRDAYWAHIEVPQMKAPLPDLALISHHDWQPALDSDARAMKLHGVPHTIGAGASPSERTAARAQLGLAEEAVASVILIGGPNAAFDYDRSVTDRIAQRIQNEMEQGRHVFVSASRRTNPETIALLQSMRHDRLKIYDGVSANPYRAYLAAGDFFFVTEDSLTMCCEALATGKPVAVMPLVAREGERLEKFRRFQAHLVEDLDVLRFEGDVENFVRSDFPDDAARAADRICDDLRKRGILPAKGENA